MPRQPDQKRCEQVYRGIVEHPGLTYSYLAKELGVSPSVISNLIISMERVDLMVSEDRYGGLWPFQPDFETLDNFKLGERLCTQMERKENERSISYDN